MLKMSIVSIFIKVIRVPHIAPLLFATNNTLCRLFCTTPCVFVTAVFAIFKNNSKSLLLRMIVKSLWQNDKKKIKKINEEKKWSTKAVRMLSNGNAKVVIKFHSDKMDSYICSLQSQLCAMHVRCWWCWIIAPLVRQHTHTCTHPPRFIRGSFFFLVFLSLV